MSGTNSNFYNKRRWKPWFILVPFAIIGFALLMGWVVMWLWNAILPELLGLKVISFWQAVGLLILSRILFGGFGGGKGRGRQWRGSRWQSPQFRERWMQMSDEEREQFKADWRERCRKKDQNN